MKKSRSIIKEQQVLTLALEEKLVANPGTVERPTIIINPYNIAPLSALLCFSTEEKESFNVSLLDGEGVVYLRYVTVQTNVHRIIVPSLVNGEVCTFTAHGSCGSEVELEFPKITIEAPMMFVLEGSAAAGTLLYALPADGAGQPIALNASGKLCWTLTLPLNHRLTFLENGHFLCGAPLQLAPPYSGTAIWEMDALGHVYREIRFENGFISDFALLSDDTIVAITQKAWQGTIRDTLIWLDHETGLEKMRLCASDVLPAANGTAGQSGTDWFQGMSLRYDRKNNLLYWSGLAQNVVLEIDAKQAKVLRIIGCTEGWDDEQTCAIDNGNTFAQNISGWFSAHTRMDLFKRPVVAGTFNEAYGVERLGNALYYINANRYPRGKKIRSTPFNINRLDLQSGSVSMFLPNVDALISPVFCDLTILDEQRILVLTGGLSNSESLNPALFARERQEDIALSAQVWYYVARDCKAKWIFDDNLVHANIWQPKTLDFFCGRESIQGKWREAGEIDIDLPYASEGRLEEDMHIEFWQDDARLYLSGTFYKGEACTLIMRQGRESHAFYLTTNRVPFGSEWLYTYSANDIERRLNWAIPCSHLHGNWQIDLLIDDILYHSEETAEF